MKLITGGTGFLGSHLIAELLERGGKIRAIKRKKSDLSEFHTIIKWRLKERSETLLVNVEWVEGDILDYESLTDAMEDVDEVYHCAAVVSFWPKMRQSMYQINVEGTANVVNACLEKDIKRLCYSSSIAALGRSGDGKLIDEETPWVDSPDNSHYAISKHLAEMEVWRGSVEGLKPVIVNPGVILGEGNWEKGSCRLLHSAFNGMSVYTDSKNGYVDVTDVARIMAELMEKQVESERFVLVGENIRMLDFLSQAAAMKGNKPPFIKVGKILAALAWRIFAIRSVFTGTEPLITKETARTASKKYEYSSLKLSNKLNYKFKSVKNTLERTVSKVS